MSELKFELDLFWYKFGCPLIVLDKTSNDRIPEMRKIPEKNVVFEARNKQYKC